MNLITYIIDTNNEVIMAKAKPTKKDKLTAIKMGLRIYKGSRK